MAGGGVDVTSAGGKDDDAGLGWPELASTERICSPCFTDSDLLTVEDSLLPSEDTSVALSLHVVGWRSVESRGDEGLNWLHRTDSRLFNSSHNEFSRATNDEKALLFLRLGK